MKTGRVWVHEWSGHYLEHRLNSSCFDLHPSRLLEHSFSLSISGSSAEDSQFTVANIANRHTANRILLFESIFPPKLIGTRNHAYRPVMVVKN